MPEDDPTQLGLAEFVSHLIGETFDAVAESQLSQEQRIAELTASAELDLETFARTRVEADDVDALLTDLFGPGPRGAAHPVVVDAVYRPAGPRRDESPAYGASLGVSLVAGTDFTAGRRTRLTVAGVSRLRDGAALQLAAQQQAVARTLVANGIPRVMVDSGRVNAKVTYQLKTSTGEQGAVPAQPTSPVSVPRDVRSDVAVSGLPLRSLDEALAHRVLRSPLSAARWARPYRVLVRNADERAPQSSQVAANAFGEIEVTFKTIT